MYMGPIPNPPPKKIKNTKKPNRQNWKFKFNLPF